MITDNIFKAWTAGFVRRWHTQPQLVDSNDPDSGHQHRCTILLLLFWPNSSRASIIDTLVHDQGECDVGDMARPAKQSNPQVRNLLEEIEKVSILKQGFQLNDITNEELLRRKFVDLLDSYVWMLRHKPHMHKFSEWEEQRDLLDKWASDLEIYRPYLRFIQEAERQLLP